MPYYNADGREISLSKLVRIEPDWAASQIECYKNQISELNQQIMKLHRAIASEDLCTQCGRKKAHSWQDCVDGRCPKWWAVRDPDADRDCVRVRNNKMTTCEPKESKL